MEKLSVLADILSIIGFLFTMISWWFILQVKKSISFRSNVIQYIKDIDNISKEITSLLSNYESNLDEIYELVMRVEAKLGHLESGAKSKLKEHINEAKENIIKYKNIHNRATQESKVREIKTKLTIIVDELEMQKRKYLIGVN
ncbi:hypothetical protein [Rodentibacter caecimuris]|uniref:hypothetical protein n=2 Tax=Rodentibacter caecimuris TaxID=1796644 RepID=UPI0013A09D6C|nr:hypothetical protein [Rodentibacter heylii]QIA77660.1 hypothetical protein FEE42_10060 [Rodentibacter heylii]